MANRLLSMLLAVLLLAVLLLAACRSEPQPLKLQGATMGTQYNITLTQAPATPSVEAIQQEIDSLLKQVNDEMSTYQADSLISEFNRSDSTDWFPVSVNFMRVTQTALELSRLSAGAYDVTLAPLIDLWGFGSLQTDNVLPSDEAIQSARDLVGYEKLILQTSPAAIRKSDAALSIDFSSIAKGFGVDVIAAYLERIGSEHYLVEIGGELRTKGKNPEGQAWRIAVEKPVAGERSVQRVIEVFDQGVATSGDYRNYFEKDGVRYSHVIDASTGRPITHRLASVTVLADTAMQADGWATALMVMGEEAGFRLAEQEGVAAYFVYKQDADFTIRETRRFKELTTVDTE